MAGSVTAPASLIERLPADKRVRSLQLLSRNANAPGAGVKQQHRARSCLSTRFGNLGIFLIETRPAPLAADVGGYNPPGVLTVTISSVGTMTPTTTDITTSELDPVTFPASGAKQIYVSAPAGLKGEAVVTV
jgi:hypothetical protein